MSRLAYNSYHFHCIEMFVHRMSSITIDDNLFFSSVYLDVCELTRFFLLLHSSLLRLKYSSRSELQCNRNNNNNENRITSTKSFEYNMKHQVKYFKCSTCASFCLHFFSFLLNKHSYCFESENMKFYFPLKCYLRFVLFIFF